VIRRRYGAAWWHLAVLLASLVLAGYAASRLVGNPALFRIVVWFVGAALVWDLLLGPAFALGDRALHAVTRRVRGGGVPLLNYVRVPAALSLLLLLVWAPSVLQRSQDVYAAKAGLSQDPYLGRWVAITAVLFVAAAVAYGVARLRGRRSSTG
jgi:hypothetical protein